MNSPSLLLTCPPGYSFIERARPRENNLSTNHGGIAVFYKDTFKCHRLPIDLHSMEAILLRLNNCGNSIILAVIYRPGSQPITNQFFNELEHLIETVLATNCKFVITGDLNIHVDDTDDRHAVQFHEVMSAYGLKQHVSSATHLHGHTLDLVITADDTNVASLVEQDVQSLSDHKCIHFTLNGTHGTISGESKEIVSRNWSAFDSELFEEDLANSELAEMSTEDVDLIFHEYDSCLSRLLDKHAPLRTVRRKPRRNAEWFDSECHKAKKIMRRLEDVYRRTRLSSNHDDWRRAMSNYRNLLKAKEQQYHNARFADAAQNPRKLWNSLNHLLKPAEPEPQFDVAEFASSVVRPLSDHIWT